MSYERQITQLQQKLKEPLPGLTAQNRMASRVRALPSQIPQNARESAVMALLFPAMEELYLLLIKRIEDGKPHSGQISFPGGRKDMTDTDLQTTALRETYEEVGIPPSEIQVLGGMSSLYIPVSNSNVFPYVGYVPRHPEYILSATEVQYVLEVPVRELFNPDIKSVKSITPSAFPDITIKAPVYEWDKEHIIWGATAMMISELEELMSGIIHP